MKALLFLTLATASCASVCKRSMTIRLKGVSTTTSSSSSTSTTTKTISTTAKTTSTTTTTTTTSNPTCSAGPRIINGRQCKIECNVDHPGGDYGNSRTLSFEKCVQACAADPKCVTAQYHKDNGYCYFEGVLNAASSNTNDDTVICAVTSSTTTTTTTTKSTTKSATISTTTTTKPTTTTTTKPTTTTTTTTPVCNPNDQCVSGASARPTDCSSFLVTTIMTCKSTSTVSTTVTLTNAPVTSVVTSIVSETDTITDIATSVDVSTIEDTITVTSSTEIDTTLTVTQTITTTVPAGGNVRRDVSMKALPVLPDITDKARKRSASPLATTPFTTPAAPSTTPRVPSTTPAVPSTTPATTPSTTPSVCQATTISPSSINGPAACTNGAQFSSACSCAGITAGTVTASQMVTTTTITSTVQLTPTTTVTSTITSSSPVTVTVTTVLTSTFETTDATLVIPTATTVTFTETGVAVVTVTAQCSAYNFVATNGYRAGEYLEGGMPDPNTISYGFVDFTTDLASAGAWTIRSDGRVYEGPYGWVTNEDSLYYILQMTDTSEKTYGVVHPVTCTINIGASSYPGAAGTLSCSTQGHFINLVYCDSTDNDLIQSANGDNGCELANLVAIPAC